MTSRYHNDIRKDAVRKFQEDNLYFALLYIDEAIGSVNESSLAHQHYYQDKEYFIYSIIEKSIYDDESTAYFSDILQVYCKVTHMYLV